MPANKKKEVSVYKENNPKRKTVDLWVGRNGSLYVDADSASYSIATHRRCEKCGELAPITSTLCDICRDENSRNRYLKMPIMEYDGNTPFGIYESDIIFLSEEDLLEYAYSQNIDPRIIDIVPLYECYPTIDADEILSDYCCDDIEIDQVNALVNEFNEEIKLIIRQPLLYPSHKRLDFNKKYTDEEVREILDGA